MGLAMPWEMRLPHRLSPKKTAAPRNASFYKRLQMCTIDTPTQKINIFTPKWFNCGFGVSYPEKSKKGLFGFATLWCKSGKSEPKICSQMVGFFDYDFQPIVHSDDHFPTATVLRQAATSMYWSKTYAFTLACKHAHGWWDSRLDQHKPCLSRSLLINGGGGTTSVSSCQGWIY